MSEGQSPLEQFKIKYYTDVPEIFGANLNFSNSSMFMVFVITAVSLFLILSMKRRELVPGRWQSMAELSYELVANMIKDNVGNEGKPYFPIIFSLFMFVLFCNLFGMLPYSFTVTSHISITFALASLVFIGVTVIAIVKHGVKFFGFFLPAGTPWWMAPLMYFIELFAYLARPVSLSIRLAANMMAGHTMLKVIAGFVVSLGITLGWAPLAMLVVLTGFEIFVAVLQAYIFTVLTCVYLNDALHLH
ncbi:MAG: F0F1 ATP synthase subunit A [Rickettsiales bacterium]|nr:F0F1 ATP synthase subunit A [Pseudomonadota bacterium]MDA0967154.1 F0F1 ATP synthase subunit A [Pseudomonadota bacterium]MDG4544339.1 F0F1 ATP synthase subunit A [Rickettsiales bacterium]MDG4546469.1 F0F1 ATP synthase subunit A [Rickettsiales bacterium]MDG4548615.1 F0F1 ATP synthase subunit A [Rickettsiales bacterium]